MESTPGLPQAAFARFVRRAVDDARAERGWRVVDVATHTGVGRSTLFRWLAGDWQDYPELAKIRAFCAALDIPVAAAFQPLGLPDAKPARRRAVDAARAEASVRAILEQLADPTVPTEEKRLIRQTLDDLARRRARRAG